MQRVGNPTLIYVPRVHWYYQTSASLPAEPELQTIEATIRLSNEHNSVLYHQGIEQKSLRVAPIP